jgi:diguanylate cyclase (GGDEF)-like protein
MPSRVDYAQRAETEEGLPHPWRVSAAAPIRVEGRLWGALGVVSGGPGRLADDAEQRLERFADFVGIAIANAEARESLLRQASTDPLTGLAHHGAFHDSLCEEVARATRYGHPLSLAVIDIDHFKRVNDAHGHQVGDQTLRGVAEQLEAHARAIDVIARIGGEEFAWLMPQTSAPGAWAAVERFRVSVGDAAFGAVQRLTVSAGIAALEAGGDESELFRRADEALYRAKGAGRDRTMVSAGGVGEGVA